jgi:hypothetical protein
MPTVTIDWTIQVGHLIAAGSVLVAAATLAGTRKKDRELRHKEYADRIRDAASRTLAAVERWKELALHFYVEIQPLITDTDTALVASQDLVQTRDLLWRGLVSAHAATMNRILDANVEGAYTWLYAYDPAVRDGYLQATRGLRLAADTAFYSLLDRSQNDVRNMGKDTRPFESAHLGNKLRDTTAEVAKPLEVDLEQCVAPLRSQLLGIISASDGQLVARTIVPARAA